MVGLSETFVVATFVQAILYGLFLATTIHSLRWLMWEDEGWKLRSRDKINWIMLFATLLIFGFSTADLAITLLVTSALVSAKDLISDILTAVTVILESSSVLVIDSVLIYRCWLVYEKSWRVIIIPLLSWISGATCMILYNYYLMRSIKDAGQITIFTSLTRRLLAGFFCCTLFNNIYATCAISYRIWSVARTSRSKYLYVTYRIFGESGIICASTTVPLMVAAAVVDTENIFLTVSDVVNFSMIGIAFNLIIIRVGQQRSGLDYMESTRETNGQKRGNTVVTGEASASSSEATTDSQLSR